MTFKLQVSICALNAHFISSIKKLFEKNHRYVLQLCTLPGSLQILQLKGTELVIQIFYEIKCRLDVMSQE